MSDRARRTPPGPRGSLGGGGGGMAGGRGRGRGRGELPRSDLLAAAALQDHFARNLNMPSLRPTRRLPQLNKPPQAPHAGSSAAGAEPSWESHHSLTRVLQGQGRGRGQQGPEQAPIGGAAILSESREPKLTLAQKMGLVARPKTPLSAAQWEEVHEQWRTREGATRGCPPECPICREEFCTEQQVLLSCSHVFHRQCIASFEKFSDARCCPVCRTTFYQKRIIHDGVIAYRAACAVRIQAHWRRYSKRKWFVKLLASIPPKDPDERRHWFAGKLQDLNDGLFAEMDATRSEVDALFAEIDERRTCEAIATGAQPPAPSVPLGPILSPPPSPQHPPPPPPSSAPPPDVSGVDWDSVIVQALERGDTECPICIGDLHRRGSKGISWLSCTHVFHVDCISAFERFNDKRQQSAPEEDRKSCNSCPVCRADYVRRQFDM